MPFNQPVFFSALAASLPYSISLGWLYKTYRYDLSPREKEFLWAGLYSNKSYFTAWSVTALLSAVAFLVNWIMASSSSTSSASFDLGRWDTPETYIFASLILIQAAYNTSMVVTAHSTSENHWGENLAVAVILWAAVLASLLQWFLAWQLRLEPTVQWILHALNFVMVFHAVWWDALFWWWTWVQARRGEAKHIQTLRMAERETLSIVSLEVHDSSEDMKALRSKNARSECVFHDGKNKTENIFLYTPLFTERPTFESLSYYPYFPHFFTSCENNNYYYP